MDVDKLRDALLPRMYIFNLATGDADLVASVLAEVVRRREERPWWSLRKAALSPVVIIQILMAILELIQLFRHSQVNRQVFRAPHGMDPDIVTAFQERIAA